VGGPVLIESSRGTASRRLAAGPLLLIALASGPAGGAPPNGDVDGSGVRDVADVIVILDHLFRGGDLPEPGVARRGLPTTGVVTCQGDAGPIACPPPGSPFHGQDAGYPALPHDYEVVKPDPQDESTWFTIDRSTGLFWQYGHSPERMTWPEATGHVEGLELGGVDGWRLPNALELASIVDFDPGRPALDPEAFRLALPDPDFSVFWSSTTIFPGGSEAYVLSFADRAMYFSPKDPGYRPAHVRAVRSGATAGANGDTNGDGVIDVSDAVRLLLFLFTGGPPPVPLRTGQGLPVSAQCIEQIPGPGPCNLQSESDGAGLPRDLEVIRPDVDRSATWYTVDHATGLAWQHDESVEAMSWEEALAHCEALELGGFSDWRMPSVKELQSIVNHAYMLPALDTTTLGSQSWATIGGDHWGFWSATPGFALLQDIGLITRTSLDPGITHHVRAVRTLEAQN
jgi:hypothetical protein